MTKQASPQTQIALNGIAASPGVVIGHVFRIHDRVDIPRYTMTPERVEAEIHRLSCALEHVKRDLNAIRSRILSDGDRKDADIFQVHVMILEDAMFLDRIRQEIETRHINAEAAVADVGDEFIQAFSRAENAYMREKSADLRDLVQQILSVLTGQERLDLSNLEAEVVVLAHDLTPSDTVLMRKNKIVAFATEVGTRISHTAILARSLGIPAVVGLGGEIAKAETGDMVIIDGTHGHVVLHPDAETVQKYQVERERYHAVEIELSSLREAEVRTLDGQLIEISANIEFPEEVELIKKHGAKGIGLYRTEYFFMGRDSLPSEDELFESYRYVLERVSPDTTVIRTLDLGGDKLAPNVCYSRSLHSLMGLRSIRLCLKHPEIFLTQLRAILRASAYGNLKMMFPMISGLDELREAKRFVEQARAELTEKGIPFNPEIDIGIMIELPSAAIIADLLAKEVDFFSIGTNDLIQYALGVDRRNEEILSLYEPFHPAVLRLIQNVVRVAGEVGIEVSLCGEMAGDPVFSVLLVGMGLTKLSMSPTVIPEIKKVLCSTSIKEAKALVGEIMQISTAWEIEGYIWKEAFRRFPELLNWV